MFMIGYVMGGIGVALLVAAYVKREPLKAWLQAKIDEIEDGK